MSMCKPLTLDYTHCICILYGRRGIESVVSDARARDCRSIQYAGWYHVSRGKRTRAVATEASQSSTLTTILHLERPPKISHTHVVLLHTDKRALFPNKVSSSSTPNCNWSSRYPFGREAVDFSRAAPPRIDKKGKIVRFL